MKFIRNEHSRFVQWLDRTAEKNPLLWLPCVLLIALSLAGEHIAEYTKIAYLHRNTEKVVKERPQLERKPFALRFVAMSLVVAFGFMFIADLGQVVYADEYYDLEDDARVIDSSLSENVFDEDFNVEQEENGNDILLVETTENYSEVYFEDDASSAEYEVAIPENDEFEFIVVSSSSGATLTIKKYIGNNTDVVIPATLGGIPITVIGEDAFRNMDFIKSITFSDNIIDIQSYAFYGCTNLTTVNFSQSIKKIGVCAFYRWGCCNCNSSEIMDTKFTKQHKKRNQEQKSA